MMGLYIKGEKLPKYGYNELRVCPNGTLEFRDKTDVLVRIPHAVIEVKEPHGDLIDKEEVFKVIENETLGSRWGEEIGTDEETYIGKFETIDDIDMIPTVIEAEHERNTSND